MAIYYINSIYGLDTNDGLTKNTQLKTLQRLLDTLTNFTEDTTIVLSKGTYTCDNTLVTKIQANITVNVVGTGLNTILQPITRFGAGGGTSTYIGVSSATLNIYKLILDMTNMGGSNANAMRNFFNLSNVVIYHPTNDGFGSFVPVEESTYIFKNCIAFGEYNVLLRTTNGKIKLYNSYGRFSNGYTGGSGWNIENNVTTTTPLLNNRYEILEPSVSGSVGVYSGDYPWGLFILIKENNQYYSISNEFYDIETQSYQPLSKFDFDYQFYANDLLEEVTFEQETFRPIDKFKNFKIIVADFEVDITLSGLQTTKQLIVANDDIITSIASNIDYFNLISEITGAGLIKLALTTDKGSTWKTWISETSEFEDLNCTIPTTPYKNMTAEERWQWNEAMDIILDCGISADVFNTLDFNLLNNKTLRFAYVLVRPQYIDNAETNQLNWKFDAKGSLQKMTDSECKINVYDKQVKVTSLIDNPIIKVNLMV